MSHSRFDRSLKLYMFTNRFDKSLAKISYIGCTRDVQRRLDQFNCGYKKPAHARSNRSSLVNNVSRAHTLRAHAARSRAANHQSSFSSSSSTFHTRGYWNALLVIVVPPSRSLDARALSIHWNKSRSLLKQFQLGVRIAQTLKLPWFINMSEFTNDTRFVELPDYALLCTQVSNSSVAHIRSAFCSASLPPRMLPYKLDGLSFVKSDKPMHRYTKSKKQLKKYGQQTRGLIEQYRNTVHALIHDSLAPPKLVLNQ